MSKKESFKNISLTGKKLGSGLDDFLNKSKEKIKPEEITPIPDKKPKPETSTTIKAKEEKTENGQNKKNILHKNVITEELNSGFSIILSDTIPDDFKGHSALFSTEQLNTLRKTVNFIKWKHNPKFSIQLAIFEALNLLFENRVPLVDFPNDFVTYSPSFSMKQWVNLESFVNELKFKENPKYALKYGLYEAINMFLYKYPI